LNFAREGLPFIVIAALLAAGGYAWALNRRSWPLWLLAFVLTLLALWVAYFFRDPERVGERGEQLVIAPADGRIVMISEVDEATMLKSKAVRVSIFMNVFNVHVNRYPVTGKVFATNYNPGKFLNAAEDKASLDNEQSTVGIDMGKHKILVRQIAGLVARRIVTYSKVGDSARQGDRFGIIRFGSRVDVFMPVGSAVRVKVGEHTTAGVTVIGDLPR
jgi:phosphatidylserine decarboxylase